MFSDVKMLNSRALSYVGAKYFNPSAPLKAFMFSADGQGCTTGEDKRSSMQ